MKRWIGFMSALLMLLLAGCGSAPAKGATVPDSDLRLDNVTDMGCDLYRKDELVGGIFSLAMEPAQVQVQGMEDTQWFALVKQPMVGMVPGDYDFFSGSGLQPGTVTLTFYHPNLGEYSHYIFPWGDQVFDLWTRPDSVTDGETEQVMAFLMEQQP